MTPVATTLQHMHDTANHAVIIHPLNASYIRRQQRLDLPLLVIQPKCFSARSRSLLPKTNQDRIVREKELMSSDPSESQLRQHTEFRPR